MLLLHTSDWHLGKKLDQFSRLEEQKQVMEEICQLANDRQVDAVIIAGDVFDTFNPAVEAIELFYRSLKKLSNNGLRPVIVIAGNHDSPDRIEAPDPLARELGIIFIGYPNTQIPCFKLDTGLSLIQSAAGFLELQLVNKEKLRILTTPYANELRLRQCLNNTDSEQDLRDILENSWKKLAKQYCDDKGVNLLLAHLFVTKKGKPLQQEPDDEKPILHIGGAQAIYSHSIPKQIQYTALGHLHRKQVIDDSHGPIVYCGTPIAYSFAETNQKKYIALVNISAPKEGQQKAKIDYVELKHGKRLLRQQFTQVAEAINWLEKNQHALVEISLEMKNYLTTDEKKSLYAAHRA